MGINFLEIEKWQVKRWYQGVRVEGQAEEVYDIEHQISINSTQIEKLFNIGQFFRHKKWKRTISQPRQFLQIQHEGMMYNFYVAW